MGTYLARVFISHSSADDDLATYIYGRLHDRGVHVWVDRENISAGDNFVSRIEDALSTATHVLLLLSPKSAVSLWVREERNVAQIAAIEGTKRLIPILVPGFVVDDIPYLLRGRIYIDLNRVNLDQAIDIVLTSIGEEEKIEPPREVANTLKIESIDVLRANKFYSNDVALEILVANSSNIAASIRQVAIESSRRKHLMYFMSPPTWIYHIRLSQHNHSFRTMLVDFTERFKGAVKPARTEQQLLSSISEGDDDWSKSMDAVLVDAPYETRLTTIFPTYLDILPRERGRLRFVFSASSQLQGSETGQFLDPHELVSNFVGDSKTIPIVKLPPSQRPSYGSTTVLLKDQNGSVSGARTADSSLLVSVQGGLNKRGGWILPLLKLAAVASVLTFAIGIGVRISIVDRALCAVHLGSSCADRGTDPKASNSR